MTAITYFRAQAYNNAWSNYRLLTPCKKLSGDELAATRTGFFPSIIHTLNHILTVDWLYVGALEGRGVKYADIEEIPCPAIADLEREQRTVDRRLLALCDALNDAQLAESIDIIRDDWVQTERKDRTLLHLFQHQIHHRGQVHAMLSGTGVAPPQLDEFFMGHEREHALRTEDFAALDFDEEVIWR
ncbi:MAG: DinB family protein [Woeseia sp.]